MYCIQSKNLISTHIPDCTQSAIFLLAKYYNMSNNSPIVSHDINCGNSIFGFPFSLRKDIILIAEIELNP